MFKFEVSELYKYLTKTELSDKFSIIKKERKSIALYEFENVAWVLKPKNSNIVLSYLNFKRFLKDGEVTKLFFINQITEKNSLSNNCRKLTKRDLQQFQIFLNSNSKDDRDEGMVSLDDSLVYGLFEEGLLVAVASLWHWGPKLSDIGILVHPRFRKKGYAKTVCISLMKSIDRKYIWRSDVKNKSSISLAKSIGFVEAGTITGLEI